MVWTSTSPDGTKSVATNTPIMAANTTYTETTLNVDHYWNEDPNLDGHHRFMQTVATNSADSSLETNATLATDMNLVYYSRFKTATESVAQQDAQPYASNVNTTGIMQLLGIRACVLFNVAGGVPAIRYKHNVSGVTRNSTGNYTITFANDLPSVDYMMIGGAVRGTSNKGFNVSVSPPISNKALGSCKILTLNTGSGDLNDPQQAWVIMFGG